MPVISDGFEQRKIRMNDWLKRIAINLDGILFKLQSIDKENIDFETMKLQVLEQFRLIRVLRDVVDNKTQLHGVDMITPNIQK